MNTTKTPQDRSDIDLLRAALPAPALSDESLAEMRANAFGALAARATARNPRYGRLGLVAAAVTLVAGVGVTVALRPLADTASDSTPDAVSVVPVPLVGPDASAVDTLVTLAAHTTGLRPLSIRPGQFVYEHSRSRGVNEMALVRGRNGQNIELGADDVAQVISESEHELWLTSDGLQVVRLKMTTDINAHPLTAEDARKLAAKGKTVPAQRTQVLPDPNGDPKMALEPRRSEPGVGNPTLSWLASLPTDPRQLLAVFRAASGTGAGNGDDRLTFKTIVSFAGRADALLSPELRTTLYQAIALLPGIERTPGGVDFAGRSGVAIGRTAEGVRTEIILDPVTSRVLGDRMVAAGRTGVPAGTVLGWSTHDEVVVGSVGATS